METKKDKIKNKFKWFLVATDFKEEIIGLNLAGLDVKNDLIYTEKKIFDSKEEAEEHLLTHRKRYNSYISDNKLFDLADKDFPDHSKYYSITKINTEKLTNYKDVFKECNRTKSIVIDRSNKVEV